MGAVLPNCHRCLAQSDGYARNIWQFFAAIGSVAQSIADVRITQGNARRRKTRRPGIEFVSTMYRGYVPVVTIPRKTLLRMACGLTQAPIILAIAWANLLPETIAKRSRSGETW
jgi:hypothetical protein